MHSYSNDLLQKMTITLMFRVNPIYYSDYSDTIWAATQNYSNRNAVYATGFTISITTSLAFTRKLLLDESFIDWVCKESENSEWISWPM